MRRNKGVLETDGVWERSSRWGVKKERERGDYAGRSSYSLFPYLFHSPSAVSALLFLLFFPPLISPSFFCWSWMSLALLPWRVSAGRDRGKSEWERGRDEGETQTSELTQLLLHCCIPLGSLASCFPSLAAPLWPLNSERCELTSWQAKSGHFFLFLLSISVVEEVFSSSLRLAHLLLTLVLPKPRGASQ